MFGGAEADCRFRDNGRFMNDDPCRSAYGLHYPTHLECLEVTFSQKNLTRPVKL
jgi:hypothetical protein